jgi:lycopene beta-cyclase
VVLDPDPERGWPATYGCWVDELAALGFDSMAARSWERVVVWGQRRHELGRAYALIDNDRLRCALLQQIARPVCRARITAVRTDPAGLVLHGHDGEEWRARWVVDTAGLTVRVAPPAWQVASGIVGQWTSAPAEPDSCVFMDWRPVAGADRRLPSFLYAMDLGDGRWFVEETSLAARAGVDHDQLAARLEQRLGEPPLRTESTEIVHIPMGVPLPRPEPGVLRFGAVAGLGHPATGYSVVASLRAAVPTADALLAGGPELASRRLWSGAAIRRRRLEEYGLRALLGMDQLELAAFFNTFFDLPTRRWASYLSGTASARSVAAVMAELFVAAPAPVKRRLAAVFLTART